MRYTNKALQYDCDEFNQQLESAGSDKRLEVGSRYGYSAVDIYTVPRKYGRVDRNLETGSPRDCLSAAETYYYQQLLEVERAKNAKV